MPEAPATELESVDRRRFGVYYTPDDVSAVLVAWALPDSTGKLLDPSFGGCSILRSALDLGRASGRPDAVSVYGIDVDAAALEHGRALQELGVPADHLLHADFFAVDPSAFGDGPFDAIGGNPPYIRHHWHRALSRSLAIGIAEESGVALPRRADAWAYFVVHALRFLRPGGRLIFLLPMAVLHADYAQVLLDHLSAQFAELRLVEVGERLFADASEATVVLAAAGFKQPGPATISLTRVAGTSELSAALTADASGRVVSTGSRRLWALEDLPTAAQNAWAKACSSDHVKTLGDLAKIRIGVVTGANSFFVRSKVEVDSFRQPHVDAELVVSRAADLRVAALTEDDIVTLDRLDRRTRLLHVSANGRKPHGVLAQEIGRAELSELHLRSHCARRTPWYAIEDVEVPDAFLPYMGARPARPVLNRVAATCTNAIHRLWWKKSEVNPEAIVLGAWTSLYALAAELHGRRYGGGVLKMEPSEAARLPIPITTARPQVFRELDSHIRQSQFDQATRLADQVVLADGLGLPASTISALRKASLTLKARRADGSATND